MAIDIQIASEADIPALTAAMAAAFDDDSRKHLGKLKGGPPGYDNGDFFRKWLLPYKESHGYKILADERVVGGFIVWILPSHENILGTIFVDPAFQDRGIGTQAFEFIFQQYPETQSWTLETPAFAIKNHHFYEKQGFSKIDEKVDPEFPGMLSFIFRKEMF